MVDENGNFHEDGFFRTFLEAVMQNCESPGHYTLNVWSRGEQL